MQYAKEEHTVNGERRRMQGCISRLVGQIVAASDSAAHPSSNTAPALCSQVDTAASGRPPGVACAGRREMGRA